MKSSLKLFTAFIFICSILFLLFGLTRTDFITYFIIAAGGVLLMCTVTIIALEIVSKAKVKPKPLIKERQEHS